MNHHRVAIVAGARTPFVKAGKALASAGPSVFAKHAVCGLLDRYKVDPDGIDAIAFGAVVPERGKPNLAREIVLEAGLLARSTPPGGRRGGAQPGRRAGAVLRLGQRLTAARLCRGNPASESRWARRGLEEFTQATIINMAKSERQRSPKERASHDGANRLSRP
jgi:hypothetical protein